MSKTFTGRAILPAGLSGKALVSRKGFNAYASFYNCLHDGAKSAVCADNGNPELFGKNLKRACCQRSGAFHSELDRPAQSSSSALGREFRSR